MTFIEYMGLAKELVLVLFFSLFLGTIITTWRRTDTDELRFIPLKEYDDAGQA